MPVDLQNRLFKYFTDTLHAIITQARKSGRFDLGILGKYTFFKKIITVVEIKNNFIDSGVD